MLLGSVAIGGITQALPFLYRSFFAELYEYPANQRKKSLIFIGSIVMGLSICALFNIYWCFVIVNVVPQRNDQCLPGEFFTLKSRSVGFCNHQKVKSEVQKTLRCWRRATVLTKQHTPIFTGSRSSYYRHIRPSISRRISNSSKFRKEIVLSLRKLLLVIFRTGTKKYSAFGCIFAHHSVHHDWFEFFGLDRRFLERNRVSYQNH